MNAEHMRLHVYSPNVEMLFANICVFLCTIPRKPEPYSEFILPLNQVVEKLEMTPFETTEATIPAAMLVAVKFILTWQKST